MFLFSLKFCFRCNSRAQLRQAEAASGATASQCIKVRAGANQCGFTLIEILIALAIVAVLYTMVVPTFNRNFTEARRADAHDMLHKNARILQNCLTLAGGFNAGCNLMNTSADGHYILDEAVTQNTWQLSAVPAPGGRQASDTNCTAITLDHIGRKTATGVNTERCW